MKQYLELLVAIKERGTYKPAARENMPGTQSLFGYQFRHNLADGFPLLTTKKMYWKGVVAELLWFLRGDTNIKYLLDNGVNIWNEDAFQYYQKLCTKHNVIPVLKFDEFIDFIKRGELTCENVLYIAGYKYGDCGFQYGRVWRAWETGKEVSIRDGAYPNGEFKWKQAPKVIDQITNLINSLKNTPESRRHIVTAIDPAHDTDLALFWCHAMFQFNCRPLTKYERGILLDKKLNYEPYTGELLSNDELFVKYNIPKYYLDCQLYQRSADVILGVPFNIASYALLTEMLAKTCNMIPGEYIHTFGDVHIYDDHREAVEEQLSRTPTALPKVVVPKIGCDPTWDTNIQITQVSDFELLDYAPQPAIIAKLSTGLKK